MLAMRTYISSLLLLLACQHWSQAAVPYEELLYRGKAIPFYVDSQDPEQQGLISLIKAGRLAERMAAVVNASLRIKTDFGIGFQSCGAAQAFFSPQKRSIVICSEFVALVVKLARDDRDFIMKLPREEFAKIIDGAFWGVFLHELAHAVIATNGVPITGREEDVADQFSLWYAVNFIDMNKTPIAFPTIWFWRQMAKSRDVPSMTKDQFRQFLSNEHSLDEQRIYNVACWNMGADPAGGNETASFAGLSGDRVKRCHNEYASMDKGMRSRFKKYLKIRPLSGRW